MASTFDYSKHTRSPHRRLCSRITKTQGLLHATNYSSTQTPDRIHSIPFSYALFMRNKHNQFNLSTPNSPKITYRIFFHQPHSTCYCSYSHPDSLKLHRSHRFNNRPQPHIIYIILPSKLKLPQPNYNLSPRPTNPPPTNSHLMTTGKPDKLSPTPNYYSNWRTVRSYINLLMIKFYHYLNRN
eukprot:bmy_18191T0